MNLYIYNNYKIIIDFTKKLIIKVGKSIINNLLSSYKIIQIKIILKNKIKE